jgi:uncharacterized protein (TIGR03437 family)
MVDQSGLSVNPPNGCIPATLTVSVDPARIALCGPRDGCNLGNIIVTGPQNSITIPVTLTLFGIQARPESLTFFPLTGSPPQTQTFRLSAYQGSCYPYSRLPLVSADPAAWLGVSYDIAAGLFAVSIDARRLAAGQYTGKVVVDLACVGPVQVPVALTVLSAPPQLRVTPSDLTFMYSEGDKVLAQTFTVQSPDLQVPLTIASTPGVVVTPMSSLTPAAVSVSVPNYSAGEYHGSVRITAPGATVTVPVTMLVSPLDPPMGSPVIGSVVNFASQTQDAIAPGEIITIYGSGVGPPKTLGFTLDAPGTVATNYGGTQVLFDGLPAPLLYSSPYQTNLIVPYEIADRKSANIEVVYKSVKSVPWGVPVAPAAPAIFTMNASGHGSAAALNEDNSPNSPTNPATRGSVIQVYATGEGLTNPAGVTGSITQGTLKRPILPVAVTIGGIDAQILYAGSAAGSVNGLFQVNVVVPSRVTPGQNVPIVLSVGFARSQDGVTIAVQ